MFPNALLMSDDLFTGFVNSYQKKKTWQLRIVDTNIPVVLVCKILRNI